MCPVADDPAPPADVPAAAAWRWNLGEARGESGAAKAAATAEPLN